MKVEITYTKKSGAEVEITKPKRMGDDELAAVIEEMIKELQNIQSSLLANNDHL